MMIIIREGILQPFKKHYLAICMNRTCPTCRIRNPAPTILKGTQVPSIHVNSGQGTVLFLPPGGTGETVLSE